MKRRRLGDLYVKGREEVFSDGSDEPVKVWIQKLNTVDRQSAFRRAQAARARYLLEADNEESETFQGMYAETREFGDRDVLIGMVIAEDVAKYQQRVESETASNEETWGKDDYLQGLIDSWLGDDDNPGLARAQAEDPEDPEAKRVWAEIERWEREVNKLVLQEIDRLKADWDNTTDDTLWRKATHALLEMRANEVFGEEFDRQQIFYMVREPDKHDTRYFGTLKEIDDLDEALRADLALRCNALMVSPTEGKGSRAMPGSSTSSGPSPVAEASTPSGPQAATG